MHHVALGNKFENWLQVEFVGALIDHRIDQKLISMEKRNAPKEEDYPYWDVLIGASYGILVDLKVIAPKTKSNDISRINETLKRVSVTTDRVWFVIFAMGYNKEVIWKDLLNSFTIEEVVHTTTTCSDSECISLCAAQLSLRP